MYLALAAFGEELGESGEFDDNSIDADLDRIFRNLIPNKKTRKRPPPRISPITSQLP